MEQRKARVTISVVKGMPPSCTVRDDELMGFGVRRQKGAPSYFLQTRIRGRLQWITIGRHGSPWTPETARKHAFQLLADIQRGMDPVADRVRERAMFTVEEATVRYLEEHGPKLKPLTLAGYQHLISKHIVPSIGKLKLTDLHLRDIARLHASRSNTPRQANHMLAVISSLLTWTEKQGWRDRNSNPCPDITRYRENRRQRFLTDEEFARLGAVIDAAERDDTQNLFVLAALRLLLFTGARLREILTLQWSYVDFQRRLIFLPDSKTGAKPVMLNAPAIAVLESLPRLHGTPYVIAGRNPGDHLKDLQTPWRTLREAAGLDDVRIHDLRHSYASVAVAGGASLAILGKALGHSNPQTTQRYAHLANDPLARMAEDTGQRIAIAMRSQR